MTPREMARMILLALLLAGCGAPQCYPEAAYPNFTAYPTPNTASDTDDLVTLARVLACVTPLFPLSAAEAIEAQCYGTPALELRWCARVAIAPDWYVSGYSGEQIFPCTVPQASCTAKGQTADPRYPCSCRAMIQDNTTIWITPNRRLLPAYAVSLLTGCNFPWTPSLAPCSSPSLAVRP